MNHFQSSGFLKRQLFMLVFLNFFVNAHINSMLVQGELVREGN